MRARLPLLVAAVSALLAACGGGANDPGTMTTQQYRSLSVRDSLTVDEVESTGGQRSQDLEQRWLDEGGDAADPGLTCLYATTTFKTRYRGTARFCFDEQGEAVSVDRNRADLDEAP